MEIKGRKTKNGLQGNPSKGDDMKILDVIQAIAYGLMCVGVIGNTILMILHAFGKI